MSSNIRVTRKCEYCGSHFIAKTTVTKNCSLQCAQRAYKQKIKLQKIAISDIDTGSKFNTIESGVGSKDYLSVKDASRLFGVSEKTIRRMVKQQHFPALRFGARIILVRHVLENILKNF